MSSAEWDVSGDVLLATFSATNQVYELQAYAGNIGQIGATNISCTAFRS
jgi:hypothetical protein